MNALDALRRGDPAGPLVDRPLDERDEALLREILTTPIGEPGRNARPSASATQRPRRRFEARAVLVTACVAVVLAAGSVVALQHAPAGPSDGGSAAPSRTSSVRSELEAALFALLPAGADQAPAQTWTEASRGSTGDGFDTTGKQIVLAGACEGGGSVTITVSGRADTHLDCASPSTVGPIVLRAATGEDAFSVGVAIAAGHPRYLVKTVGLPATAPMPTSAPSTPVPGRSLAADKGCAPTSGGIPASAFTATIQDVDGDGRPDTEWAGLVPGTGDVRFGIRTASGETVTATAVFAGGANRSFVAAKLANGAVILMPSEGRSTGLWSFAGCALHEVRSSTPTYSGFFGMSIATNDDGGAATCVTGRLASLSWAADGTTTDAITARFIDVAADGSTATLTDEKTVVARHVDLSTTANERRYTGISCGASPVLALH